MGAPIGLRQTTQVCSALEIATDDVTYCVDSLNVGFGFEDRVANTNPLSLTGLAKFTNSLTLANGGTYPPTLTQQILAPGR